MTRSQFQADDVTAARLAAVRAETAIDDGRPRDALAAVAPFLEDDRALPPDLTALLLIQRGNARSDLEQHRPSLDDLEQARQLYARAGRHDEVGRVDMELGITLSRMGRPQEALQRHERAIASYQQHGTPLDVARCRLNVASCYATLGDHARERSALEEARRVFAEHGQRRNVLAATYNLALCDWRVGRLPEAREAFEELVQQYTDRGMARQLADATDDLASLLHEFGELEHSEQLHRQAATSYEVLGLIEGRCSALVSLAHTLGHAGELDEAEEVLGEAAGLATSPGAVAHVRFEQAWSALRRDRPEQALQLVEQLGHVDRARGAESALPYRRWTEGVARSQLGQHEIAVSLIEQARQGLRALGDALPVAEATRSLGLALRAAGDDRAATAVLARAAEAFATMQLEHRAAACADPSDRTV